MMWLQWEIQNPNEKKKKKNSGFEVYHQLEEFTFVE